MNLALRMPTALALLALALGLTGCGTRSTVPGTSGSSDEQVVYDTSGIDPKLTGEIRIDGSSTVYKLSQAAAEEFGNVAGNVDIAVKYAGTGGGFKSFVKGDLDICDASRPIQENELATCRENGVAFIELPISFDALTVAVNADNDFCNEMTVAELKKLWEPAAKGKIMTWSQVRDGWPNEEIALYGADTESGTFEYFTEAIVGEKNSSRSDYTSNSNDNILIQGIQGDKFALGYLPYAYYEPRQSTLKAVKIIAEEGAEAVEPTPANVENGKYQPLARPLFVYVNKKSAQRPEVKAFVEFYLKNGPAISQDVKYIPFPPAIYAQVSERFQKGTLGTAFGGKSPVGMSIADVMQLEPKS
ncbi:MAG: PstS family phosphate ABC transporter substrate-binding protein [Pirellulaceae bacterium]